MPELILHLRQDGYQQFALLVCHCSARAQSRATIRDRKTLGLGICTVALIYGLSHLVRARGRQIEPKLWARWDGPPSTRYPDTTFGEELKSSIRDALRKTFSIPLLGEDEEAAKPGHTDKEIADALRRVRPHLRQHDPDGLWSNHNAEYGSAAICLPAVVYGCWSPYVRRPSRSSTLGGRTLD